MSQHLSATASADLIQLMVHARFADMVRALADGGAGPDATLPRGRRVLIVEDEFFAALEIEDALTAAGYVVIGVATTADEAIKMSGAANPDLVLMDVHLAGAGDGIDAAAEIRKRFKIPSLFATAHSDPATRSRGNSLAAPLGWVIKPYSRAELAAAVAAALASLGPSGGFP